MSLVLQSSSGGQITIQEPTTASNFTATLPATTGPLVVTGTTPTLNGVTFPATQVPSADANTLDDYEEGTFTVTLTPNGGSMTMDAARQTFQYIKIGKLVIVQGYTRPSSVSSPTGVVRFNLPFTSTAGTQFSGYCYSIAVGENLVSGVGNGFNCDIAPSTSVSYIYYTAGGATAANWLAVGEKFQANTNIQINLIYQAAN
jgi:hypothetical protein